MRIKANKSWWLLGLGVMLGAGGAWAAADARYNTAIEGIDRATVMLNGIGTATEKPGAAFQRKRALRALERAKLRINCAKEIEDSTSKKRGCPAAMKDRFDDNDDDKVDHDDHKHGPTDKDKKERAERERTDKDRAEKARRDQADKAKQKK